MSEDDEKQLNTFSLENKRNQRFTSYEHDMRKVSLRTAQKETMHGDRGDTRLQSMTHHRNLTLEANKAHTFQVFIIFPINL